MTSDQIDELLETVAVHVGWLRAEVHRDHAHQVDNDQSAGYIERLMAAVRELRAENEELDAGLVARNSPQAEKEHQR